MSLTETEGAKSPAMSEHLNPERFISIRGVLDLVPVSRGTIYAWIRDGIFPPQRKLGPSRVAWLESDIVEWMESRKVVTGVTE